MGRRRGRRGFSDDEFVRFFVNNRCHITPIVEDINTSQRMREKLVTNESERVEENNRAKNNKIICFFIIVLYVCFWIFMFRLIYTYEIDHHVIRWTLTIVTFGIIILLGYVGTFIAEIFGSLRYRNGAINHLARFNIATAGATLMWLSGNLQSIIKALNPTTTNCSVFIDNTMRNPNWTMPTLNWTLQTLNWTLPHLNWSFPYGYHNMAGGI